MRIKAHDDNDSLGWDSSLPDTEHARRKTLYNRGLSDHEIGHLLNVTPRAITQWRNKHDYEPNHPFRHAKDWEAEEHREAVLNAFHDADTPARTMTIYDAYKERVNDPRTKRRVLDILHEHEDNGDVASTFKNYGARGRALVWSAPAKTQTEEPTQ